MLNSEHADQFAMIFVKTSMSRINDALIPPFDEEKKFPDVPDQLLKIDEQPSVTEGGKAPI